MNKPETKFTTKLLEKANNLPTNSGCYLMTNNKQDVIYIGKAKNLKARVRSYFDQSAKTVKTQFLVGHVTDFEFVITQNEAEALVLENNLIKKHTPKYNIRMRDDKSYPYVIIDRDEPFPRLKYLRRPKKKSKRDFFGPFPVGSSISLVASVLTKTFGLRDCSLREFQSRKNPCLLYQLNQCSAPCVNYISESEYEQRLQMTTNFLKGGRKAKEVLNYVDELMQKAANEERYEHAAILRDNHLILSQFIENFMKQNVELIQDGRDIDIISYFEGSEEVDICLYSMRDGVMIGHKNFNFLKTEIMDEIENEVALYMVQYYSGTHESLPDLIYTHLNPDVMNVLASAFEKLAPELEKHIQVKPVSKRFKSIQETALQTAQEAQKLRQKGVESLFTALNKLKDLLSLKEIPRRIECFDVAIWQGRSPTASQVVFSDGKPNKKLYRYYHLQERPEGNNDFAMMKELFERRIEHADLPDLFLVDGGKAQVSTVLKVLKEANVDIPVVGIAKARDLGESFQDAEITQSDERLVIPNRSNSYILTKQPALLHLCVHLRNEAHRFSRKLHHKAENARLFASWLDEIPGIGEKTKNKIQKNLDLSLSELRQLDPQAIADKFGITLAVAEKIQEYLKQSR
ncbi:MAG: excinuclease ABC subunit UvrC [Bacteriovoracaceae bacterium]|nr:excinuclease ABC subunit UvrC [Bacteriovoracaceae bacterium]